mgnify:CR=1 FL=1
MLESAAVVMWPVLVWLVLHDSAPQHSASDALAGMMMKGAVKCDKQVEEQ